MNNTILSVSSPKTYTYDLNGQRVMVTLTHNPLEFEPRTLFSLALRRNKKRGVLFVSQVLGKHTPVDPFVPLLAGAALAVQYLRLVQGEDFAAAPAIIEALKGKCSARKVYEAVWKKAPVALAEPTLFIGFAETATALGQAVFSLFKEAFYLHTTREQIPSIASELNFEEEHSHAVQHRCYPLDLEILRSARTIVLVDDELTTGKTALNIIREIQKKYPKKDYVVLSLLDWRTTESRANFRKLEQELGVGIRTVSLLAGEVTLAGGPVGEQIWPERAKDDKKVNNFAPVAGRDGLNCGRESVASSEAAAEVVAEAAAFPAYRFFNRPEIETVAVYSQDAAGRQNKTPYLKLTGRFGLAGGDTPQTLLAARRIGEELKADRQGAKTLCLGTGEFMYFPMLIAAYMGKGISYHSTTRSPIYPLAKSGYGIQNGFAYESPDNEVANYLYNVPLRYYDEAYVFLERAVSLERLIPMVNVFRALGIPRLVFVVGSALPEVGTDAQGSIAPNLGR